MVSGSVAETVPCRRSPCNSCTRGSGSQRLAVTMHADARLPLSGMHPMGAEVFVSSIVERPYRRGPPSCPRVHACALGCIGRSEWVSGRGCGPAACRGSTRGPGAGRGGDGPAVGGLVSKPLAGGDHPGRRGRSIECLPRGEPWERARGKGKGLEPDRFQIGLQKRRTHVDSDSSIPLSAGERTSAVTFGIRPVRRDCVSDLSLRPPACRGRCRRWA